ncbi:MAG: lysophospholipid acyltransferase family protein [Tannerella sp.]|jgi:KDO2-lipid IV(A) lauroyltransferase|nr:lysophospholipid acyltransferase family protein [Tannerella sp.]
MTRHPATALLFLTVKALAMLPMRILYLLSGALYFLIYRVARYRKAVVRDNMRHAFPEQTEGERRRMERKFYRHLADLTVEIIKLASIPHAELLRRAQLRNPGILRPLFDRGHTCILLLMGHCGNWEWLTGFADSFGMKLQIHQIYRPLSGKPFDRLFIYLRTRFNAFVMDKNSALRRIIRLKRDGTPSLVVFIADQTPSRANIHYRTTFLNQDTAMFTGAERIAVKLNLPVLFADVRQTRRGYYTVDFELITDRPREMPEYAVTEQYARLMERCILRDPSNWLWTHRRWKHTRPQ